MPGCSLPAQDHTQFSLEHFRKLPPRSRAAPPLTKADQTRFRELLALFFFSSKIPLERAENRYLLEALQLLRPGAQPPNRRDLAGKLLNSCYAQTKQLVLQERGAARTEMVEFQASDGAAQTKKAKLDFVKQHHSLLATNRLHVSLPATVSSPSSTS